MAKLADIGLVTELAEAKSFVGTEGFIPPEGPNSPQADIFALGKVLYEASMGKDRQEFPEPRSGLGVDADSKALMELNAVLLRACAPDPKQRYQTAEEMNADLALLLSGKSVQDKHSLERRLKLTRRVAMATIVVMLVGVVPYYLAIREAKRANAAAKNESEQRVRAEREAEKSKQVAHFLAEMLEGVGPSKAKGRDTTMLREILDNFATRIGKELTQQPAVEVDLRNTLVKVYHDLGLYDISEQVARENVTVARSRLGDDDPAIGAALLGHGDALMHQGNLQEAEGLLLEAVTRLKKASAIENTAVATTLAELANLLSTRGKLAEAQRLNLEALAIRRKLLGNDHLHVAASLNNLGIVLYQLGRLTEAEAMQHEALEIQRRALSEMDQTFSLNNLGVVLGAQNRLQEAEDTFRQSLALEKKLLGEENATVARTLSNIGDSLMRQGKLPDALAQLSASLEMKKKVLKSENPSIAYTQNSLAEVHRQLGNLEEAEALARAALTLRRKVLGPEHVLIADLLNLLGQILQSKGDLTDAEEMARDALAMRRKLPGQPRLDGGFKRLREVLQAQGKHRELADTYREETDHYRKGAEAQDLQAMNALAWLLSTCVVPELRDGRGAVAFAEKATTVTNRKNAGILDTLAAAYAEAGDFAKAISAQKEAIALVQREADRSELTSRLSLYESNTPYRDQGR